MVRGYSREWRPSCPKIRPSSSMGLTSCWRPAIGNAQRSCATISGTCRSMGLAPRRPLCLHRRKRPDLLPARCIGRRHLRGQARGGAHAGGDRSWRSRAPGTSVQLAGPWLTKRAAHRLTGMGKAYPALQPWGLNTRTVEAGLFAGRCEGQIGRGRNSRRSWAAPFQHPAPLPTSRRTDRNDLPRQIKMAAPSVSTRPPWSRYR